MNENPKKPFWHHLIPWKLIVFTVIALIAAVINLIARAITGDEKFAKEVGEKVALVLFIGFVVLGLLGLWLDWQEKKKKVLLIPPLPPQKQPPPLPVKSETVRGLTEKHHYSKRER